MSVRWIACAALLTTIVAGPARAQMFGARSLGSALSRNSGPGDSFAPSSSSGAQGTDFAQFGQGGTLNASAGSGAGQLSGNERFLRGNRRGGSFVGTDARDRRRFVGTLQNNASAAIRSATTGVHEPTTPNVNQAAATAAARSRPYDPRLSVNFDFNVPPPDSRAQSLTLQLHQSPAIHRHGPIEVSVKGQTAILRGEVASERDRVLAGLLVGLEPGIWRVQNELTSPPALSAPAQSPQVLPPPDQSPLAQPTPATDLPLVPSSSPPTLPPNRRGPATTP